MKFELEVKSFDEISSLRPKVYCKGFIPLQEGSPTMLYAGGGMGKTYTSIRMAIEYSLETGRKSALWLTEDPAGENRHRFMSICAEFYPSEKKRLLSLVKIIDMPPLRFTEYEKSNAVISLNFYEVRAALIDFGMVVIDPLIQFNGCDENSNSHAGILMGAIKTWASEESKAIVLLHHITIGDGFTKARGATEWQNACRAVYQVSKPTDIADGCLRFDLKKNNGIAWCFKNEIGELVRDLKIFPDWNTHEEIPVMTNKLFLSIATHNSAKKPEGFYPVEIDCFYELHRLVAADRAYSQYDFKDGYRLGVNNRGGATMICLDYDDGMTIETAKKKFSGLQSLIITTRSHQVEKSGKKCDRFRVIIPLETPLNIPLSDYPDFLDALSAATGGEVDPSTKDLARFYFASPTDAIYHYSDSEKKLNWNKIYAAMKIAKTRKNLENKIAEQRKMQYRQPTGQRREPQNTLPKDTIFETKDGNQSFEGLRLSLSEGSKVTCRCLEGINHGGEGDSHHSAFVKKEGGNVFYSCSGGRCAGNETKWCEE